MRATPGAATTVLPGKLQYQPGYFPCCLCRSSYSPPLSLSNQDCIRSSPPTPYRRTAHERTNAVCGAEPGSATPPLPRTRTHVQALGLEVCRVLTQYVLDGIADSQPATGGPTPATGHRIHRIDRPPPCESRFRTRSDRRSPSTPSTYPAATTDTGTAASPLRLACRQTRQAAAEAHAAVLGGP